MKEHLRDRIAQSGLGRVIFSICKVLKRVKVPLNKEGVISCKKVVIAKKVLVGMGEKDAKKLVMIATIVRDMDLLKKMMMYSRNNPHLHTPEKAAYVNMSLFLLKTTASKIWDAVEFFKKYDHIDLEKRENLPEGMKKVVENLRIYEFIRNKLSEHYEYKDEINSIIFEIISNGDDELELLETDSKNPDIIFSSFNTIVLKTILDKMAKKKEYGSNSPESLVGELIKIIRDDSFSIREFGVQHILRILDSHKVQMTSRGLFEVSAPKVSTVNLPFFVLME